MVTSTSYQLKRKREEEANVTELDQEYCTKKRNSSVKKQYNLPKTITSIYLFLYLRKFFSDD